MITHTPLIATGNISYKKILFINQLPADVHICIITPHSICLIMVINEYHINMITINAVYD